MSYIYFQIDSDAADVLLIDYPVVSVEVRITGYSINGDDLSALFLQAEYSEQGLDQVPTRLTNHPRSRCNTPNKGNLHSCL